jgi:outer membrane protein
MEGKFMTRAIRLWAAALIAALTIARADAAELAPTPTPEALPPAPPLFYLHVGFLGAFFPANYQSTGGGFFNTVAPGGTPLAVITNGDVTPGYTVALEIGYFITPNIALEISAGVPPLAHLKVTGFTGTPLTGSNLLGSVRYGPAMALLRYQFTQFGALQPYLGAGAVYLLNLGNINDGILTGLSVSQEWGFVVQAGADWMLTPNWGVFIDGKKLFLSTDASGYLLNTTIPIRTHVELDPWIASAGITFKY